jgi:ABC-2 type transport system ATP-binding protein
MKQRLKLAQALVHDPPILLLDEPTNGLDPKGRRHMLALIRDLGHALGKNLLLCSHLLPDVEKTCEHVVVIDRGRLIENAPIAELTASDGHAIRVRVAGDAAGFEQALRAAGRDFEREAQGRFLVPNGDESDADGIFALAARVGASVESVQDVRTSLDEVFLGALRSAARSDDA